MKKQGKQGAEVNRREGLVGKVWKYRREEKERRKQAGRKKTTARGERNRMKEQGWQGE